MLGILARGAIPHDLFEGFVDLADRGRTHEGPPDERGHKDGWGILCFKGAEVLTYARGPGAAGDDARYAEASRRICKKSDGLGDGESLVVLAHLRRASAEATKGREEFSHPFLKEVDGLQWGFQHNGGIKGATYERIRTLDTIYFFDAVTRAMRGSTHEHVEKAYRAAKAHILDRFEGYSSLTSILGNGAGLHAYREASSHPDYYTLAYENRGHLAIVCSEPILDVSGRPLGQEEFLHLPSSGEWPY